MTLPGSDPANSYGPVTIAHGDLPSQFVDPFRRCALVAWDVETSGLDWRQSRIGTCQLFAEGLGGVIIGIDPNLRPQRLISILEEPGVSKVFHHAPFDLRFMVNEWNIAPNNILCTKVASKIINPNARNEVHSLRNLLIYNLGVELSKGAVRTSDWTASQLSQEQIQYAISDVLHLPALLRILTERLKDLGLNELYKHCCSFLPAKAVLEVGEYPDVFAY